MVERRFTCTVWNVGLPNAPWLASAFQLSETRGGDMSFPCAVSVL